MPNDSLNEECDMEDDDQACILARECTDTLMFCYQSEFMRSILTMYAKNVICLDATYKTTDYALPLFFLVVRTPVAYVTVGAFIVQFETSQHIEEELKIFKQWCPEMNPKYWIVDCSVTEMNAITVAFPEAHIAICDFHREQAWERWCTRKENNVDKHQALPLLRKVARAATEEYEAALHNLQASSAWKDSEQLQHYFSRQWLPLKQSWVKCFMTDLQITTNNGTEAQNRKLKECYLKNCSGRRSLAGLIDVLTGQFFPDCEKEFNFMNVTSTSDYRIFHASVPSYLHNRPPAVIKHISQRLQHAAEFSASDVTPGEEHGTFIVQSQTLPGETYVVSFIVPSCSCRDFIKHQLPCKHFCAVFSFQQGWGFDNLPESYRNGPLLTLTTGLSHGAVAASSLSRSTEMDAAPGHSGGDEESGDQSAPLLDAGPELFCDLPRHQKSGMGHKRRMILSGLEKCKDIVHYCNNAESLEKALKLVDELSGVLQEGTPACRGLSLRSSPTKGCAGQKKRKLESTSHMRMRKLQKYIHPNKEHWRTKGRVGARADNLRRAYVMPPNQVE